MRPVGIHGPVRSALSPRPNSTALIPAPVIPGLLSTEDYRRRAGATTVEELRAAENDLLEYRLVELPERPGLVARTYDLAHLKALHRQLFRAVYEWARELRTAGDTAPLSEVIRTVLRDR